jgi:hypothetical protein
VYGICQAMNIPSPLQVALAISEGRNPLKENDWVVLGKAIDGALNEGLIRVDNGTNPAWGSWSLTVLGRRAVEAHAANKTERVRP